MIFQYLFAAILLGSLLAVLTAPHRPRRRWWFWTRTSGWSEGIGDYKVSARFCRQYNRPVCVEKPLQVRTWNAVKRWWQRTGDEVDGGGEG